MKTKPVSKPQPKSDKLVLCLIESITNMTTLYGIRNCDTIKKARKWLEQNDIAYTFHDYRQDGLDRAWLAERVQEMGIAALINKRGTTYRQLDEQQKCAVEKQDTNSCLDLMCANPALIKRPLLRLEHHTYLGFKPEQYESLFNGE